MLKKEETSITKANEGNHSQVAYNRIKKLITDHEYVNPRLFHVCLEGSNQIKDYQDALQALCFELRRKDMPHQWRACREVDKAKGMHLHIFILVESKYRNPNQILNNNKQSWLGIMLARRELKHYINKPRSRIHWNKKNKQLRYATLGTAEKIADCIIWLSYLVKVRSKPTDLRQIYYSSRQSRQIAKK